MRAATPPARRVTLLCLGAAACLGTGKGPRDTDRALDDTDGAATSGVRTDTGTGDLPTTGGGPQAAFTVGDVAYTWVEAAGHYVDCALDDAQRLHLRFADDPAREGVDGARLDLEVCRYYGTGAYGPHDPFAYPCGGGKTFDLWWRPSPTDGFVNAVVPSGCVLELEAATGSAELTGTFACEPLEDVEGLQPDSALRDGSFACAIVTGRRDGP